MRQAGLSDVLPFILQLHSAENHTSEGWTLKKYQFQVLKETFVRNLISCVMLQ